MIVSRRSSQVGDLFDSDSTEPLLQDCRRIAFHFPLLAFIWLVTLSINRRAGRLLSRSPDSSHVRTKAGIAAANILRSLSIGSSPSAARFQCPWSTELRNRRPCSLNHLTASASA